MEIFKKIKARIIANYVIKQIKKISKTNTLNVYLHVTENIKNTKYIYVKFNMMNGIKDINMGFIEFYNSQKAINKDVHYFSKKSNFKV